MNEKTAIDKTVEMWKWLAETGLGKWKYPHLEGSGETECFLCVYADYDCLICPYFKRYGIKCFANGQPFSYWVDADKMKYWAKRFLNRMLKIQEELCK